MKTGEVISILLALGTLLIAFLTWIYPFNPVGTSPFAVNEPVISDSDQMNSTYEPPTPTRTRETVKDVDDEIGKAKSDTLKKNMVVLDNVKEYREWQRKIRDLEDTSKKVGVITTGFNTLTWTLQSIAKLTCAEMSNIEAHGKSSLADIRK